MASHTPLNETSSDRILEHVRTAFFSAFVGADAMMKGSPLPPAIRSLQAFCKRRFPKLYPVIYVGIELPRPRKKSK
jgi:hypothetical protein